MKELLKSRLCCARETCGLGVFSFLLISLFCQVTFAEQHITQFGITWTFDKDHLVGRFANGDYWVVGPVTIIGIAPASVEIGGRVINGSMVNPSPRLRWTQGYDSAMYGRYAGTIQT
jgi:hypothetical protein